MEDLRQSCVSIVKKNNDEVCEEVVFIKINTNNDTIKVSQRTPWRTQMDHKHLFWQNRTVGLGQTSTKEYLTGSETQTQAQEI